MTHTLNTSTNARNFRHRNEESNAPLVIYNKKASVLSISGHSFLPDAEDFYQPHLDQVYQDLRELGTTTVEFQLDSFGPKTAKVLFKFFENLHYFKLKNKTAHIIWKYQSGDEPLMEMGEAFSELFSLEFEMQSLG